MATICNECGGTIPDVMFNGRDRNDCKNHSKDIELGMDLRKINLDLKHKKIREKMQLGGVVKEFNI